MFDYNLFMFIEMCPPLLSDSLDINCRYNGKRANCSNFSKPNTTATASCKPTYYSAPNGEDTPFEIYCQSNGIWNKQLYSCEPCNDMDPLQILICNTNLIRNFKSMFHKYN